MGLRIHSKKNRFFIILVLIIVGLPIRLIGIKYGLPQFFHPDEPHIISATEQFFSGDFNPHNFLYPSLLMYIIHMAQRIYYLFCAGEIASTILYIIGRFITVLFAIATIPFTYLLGKRLYNPTAGLFAAFLITFTTVHLVNSHYATTDVPLTFFVLVAVLSSLNLLENPNAKNYLISGVLAGLATSIKIPGIFVFVPILFAHFLSTKKERDISYKNIIVKTIANKNRVFISILMSMIFAIAIFLLCRHAEKIIIPLTQIFNVEILDRFQTQIIAYFISRSYLFSLLIFLISISFLVALPIILINVKHLLILLSLTIITFFVTTPYAILDYKAFMHDFLFQIVISKTTWSGMFANTQLGYVVQLGYLINNFPKIVAVFSAVGIVIPLIKKKSDEHWAVLLFSLSYFLYIGSWSIKFDRYILPVLPFYVVWAGIGFYEMIKWLLGLKFRRLAVVNTIILIGISSLCFSIAYFMLKNTYRYDRYLLKTSTRTVVYNWSLTHLPTDAKILRTQYAPQLEIAGFDVINIHYDFNNVVNEEYIDKNNIDYIIVTDKLWTRPIRDNKKLKKREAYEKISDYADLIYSIERNRKNPGPAIKIYKTKRQN